ncbi:MAG: LuxR C-terminal-related transcriptional regulator [Novosphingobium meiothermophilum]|uniref:LuxR C-terminal-related transcriptional regulator n=1 Tax=Novosphingobium TaxID=165696 RepID=UPI000D6E4846|nr:MULTISPECIES: response regulator transcription factor [Novosphingobium]
MQVLICDDHPIVASAMGMTVEAAFDAQVHIAHSCSDALDRVRRLGTVDLLLLDLHIPGEDPRENLRSVRAACPQTRVVVFSGSENPDHLRMALEMDVHGFLPKSSRPEVVEAALRLVLAGGRYLPDAVRNLALETAVHAPTAPAVESCLTQRQLQVLHLLANGSANKLIARELGISPFTAKAHVAQVLSALGAVNRTEAVAIARGRGLL